MKVYVAFDGDYSARSVVAVFSDKVKADECSGDVEEHELDALTDRTMHDVWEVRIRLDNGSLISSGKSRLFEVPNYCRTQRIADWRGGSLFGDEHAVDTASMGVSRPLSGMSMHSSWPQKIGNHIFGSARSWRGRESKG